MNLNSFRLKIALLSGLLTGLLLFGSGLVLWRETYRFSLERLDREIRSLGQANLDRVQGGDHWMRMDNALKFVSGNRQTSAFVLWVKIYDKVVYQSPDWPGKLLPESLPEPVHYESPFASKPGDPLPPPPRRGEEISPRNPALPLKSPDFYTRVVDGTNWRVGVMGNPYVTLMLAANMDEFDTRMADLRNSYLARLCVALLLVAGGAWFVARRALRPVIALTQTAERMTARGLDQRIPSMKSDWEFNRLITVFNEMMDRLDASFRQATRFSADASHELKTPLARLQAELEQALQSAPENSPQQELCSSLLDEVCHLKTVVQKLLLLSLADAGRLQLALEPVNLSCMLESVIEDSRAQAPELTVEHDLAPDIRVNADPDLLEQALQNLAGNAIKYNCTQGCIRVELAQSGNRALVRFTNTGPGIPAANHDRIFQRFYRADSSRSDRVDGVGLGLSLSREIIRAHGGELTLESSDNLLTQFLVEVPILQS